MELHPFGIIHHFACLLAGVKTFCFILHFHFILLLCDFVEVLLCLYFIVFYYFSYSYKVPKVPDNKRER